MRVIDSPNTPRPRVALLGGSGYSTIVSNSGGGYSRYGDIGVNRWRNDGTSDNHGQWCYVRDLGSGLLWSSGHQPVGVAAESYRVTMIPELVVIERRDGSFDTRTDIVVVPGCSAESRRVVVSNSSDVATEVELTSYQEIMLALPLSDRGHRAFSNLFVQTEWVPESASILAMRRPRSKEVKPSWGGHTIAVESGVGAVSFETDRARFIGRGHTSRNSVAMGKSGDLRGAAGAVLDPVFALRARLKIGPGESAQVIFSTFATEDRDQALRLAKQFSDWDTAVRPFDSVSRDDDGSGLRIAAPKAVLFQELAGLLLYRVRSPGRVIDRDKEPASTRADLLAIGVTGESPIVLARVSSTENAHVIRELLTMHRYWRLKGLAADLVFLCDTGGQQLQDEIVSMVQAATDTDVLDQPTGVFVRNADSLDRRNVDLLESIARIRIDVSYDTLDGIAHV